MDPRKLYNEKLSTEKAQKATAKEEQERSLAESARRSADGAAALQRTVLPYLRAMRDALGPAEFNLNNLANNGQIVGVSFRISGGDEFHIEVAGGGVVVFRQKIMSGARPATLRDKLANRVLLSPKAPPYIKDHTDLTVDKLGILVKIASGLAR